MYDDFLFLVPARGGSKGIPRKNLKSLNGKPLIYYTLDAIKDIAPPQNICVSTEDKEIKEKVEAYGIDVPFLRPTEFAKDTSTSQDVIEHALSFYKQKGRQFKGLVLLQPTSPLRNSQHVIEALELFSDNIDLIVSVKITSANPYYVLFEENPDGFLELSKKGSFSTRQDCPRVYERNGAIYIYNLISPYQDLRRQKKYIMDENVSIDIDSDFDWQIAEFILSKKQGSI